MKNATYLQQFLLTLTLVVTLAGLGAAVVQATTTASTTSSSTEKVEDTDSTDSSTSSDFTISDSTTTESTQSDNDTVTSSTTTTATSTITTGDAVAESQTDSVVNTTTVAATGSGTTTVSATSSAEIDNTATSSSNTGNNTATTSGDVSIITGDAVSYARIFNQANSQFINSSGAVMFFNNLLGNLSSIDLRLLPPFSTASDEAAASPTQQATSSCASETCLGQATVQATSSASITNAVTVRANSGGNTASGSSASIDTGDSFAAADVVNVANTNVVDGGYLLLSFQNFGDWGGELIFPAADPLSRLFSTAIDGAAFDNTATIDNRLQTTADTGGNTATSSAGTTTTGQASSHSTVINQANTNLVNSDRFMVALRVHGSWAGKIFNAPDNLVWGQDDSKLFLFSLSSGTSTGSTGGGLDVTTGNQANIENDVEVMALTGDNQLIGNESGKISTGDAYSGANVINVVNTNVVGRNMLLATLNIFGDWNGNISFGQPDLWVGGVADATNEPELPPGSEAEITYEIVNRGDAPASDVTLSISGNQYLQFISPTAATSSPQTTLSIPLPDIDPEENLQVRVRAAVSDDLSDHNVVAEVESSLTQHETDGNQEDNQEVITLMLNQKTSSGGGGGVDTISKRSERSNAGRDDSSAPQLAVDKTLEDVRTTATSTQVDYRVVAKNNSAAELTDGVVVDEITDVDGDLLNTEVWELGTVFSGEEITITYTSVFEKQVGTVTNAAQLQGYTEDGQRVVSSIATTSTEIGAVLGVQSDLSVCRPYLQTQIRRGDSSNPEAVRKLQQFLIDHEEADHLRVTGEFDTLTDITVRRFQMKYAGEILAPWGITDPTGNVYRTTLTKINELACGDRLTIAQLKKLEEKLKDLQSWVAARPEFMSQSEAIAVSSE